MVVVVQPHFNECVINVWNSLPESADFNSIDEIKKSIHKIDFTKFLRCF